MNIEEIQLHEAIIYENMAAIAIDGIDFSNGNCFNSMAHLLSEFEKCEIAVDEIICVRDASNGLSDIFVTFDKNMIDIIINHISRSFQESCKYSIQNSIVQIRITGSGFARSHEFLQKIYNNLSEKNINILAQMCSDLEVIVFCANSNNNNDRNISQAMNNIGVKYQWANSSSDK